MKSMLLGYKKKDNFDLFINSNFAHPWILPLIPYLLLLAPHLLPLTSKIVSLHQTHYAWHLYF